MMINHRSMLPLVVVAAVLASGCSNWELKFEGGTPSVWAGFGLDPMAGENWMALDSQVPDPGDFRVAPGTVSLRDEDYSEPQLSIGLESSISQSDCRNPSLLRNR